MRLGAVRGEAPSAIALAKAAGALSVINATWTPSGLMGPVPLEQIEAGRGSYYDGPAFYLPGGDQSAIVGILPDRQFRAGGAPGVHHFLVGPLADGQPVE